MKKPLKRCSNRSGQLRLVLALTGWLSRLRLVNGAKLAEDKTEEPEAPSLPKPLVWQVLHEMEIYTTEGPVRAYSGDLLVSFDRKTHVLVDTFTEALQP